MIDRGSLAVVVLLPFPFVLTTILVAAKAFGFASYSWYLAFVPILAPIVFLFLVILAGLLYQWASSKHNLKHYQKR